MATTLSRITRFLIIPLALGGLALAQEDDPTPTPTPAPTQEPGDAEAEEAAAGAAACTATGYLVESDDELSALRSELNDQSVHLVGGVPLESGLTWVVPDGSQPVVVLDATAPLSHGTVLVSVAGQEFEAATQSLSGEDDDPRHRYVTNVSMPHLGPTVRSLGMTVQSPPCELMLALSVDRSVWSTLVGGPAIAVTALFGLLTVLVARLRKGGWLRRFGFAAPFGLLAGAGQAAVLVEAGVVSPFASPPWWPPVAGLALAAVLPLTRWRRRARLALEPLPPPPASAPLGGYRIDHPVTRTEVAVIYRATRTAPPPSTPPPPAEAPPPSTPPPPVAERALVKVALPHRYGEPVARLRLEREAQALTGLAHPNVLGLREAIPALAGPPTLVFDDADGVPLRQALAAGGTLSGPQVVNVVLGVLGGLGPVHGRGLVHRDVRSDNVWLTTDGRVLLAGFELACAGMEHPVAPEGIEPYASPEQRYGRPLDERSDLWACGVLLGELLTGRVPPQAVDPATTGGQPVVAADGLPGSLARMVGRALAEDPAGRPATAERFAADLRTAADAAFGADWAARGALAGALVAHGAIGAGVAGYALAGGAASGGVAGGAAAGGAASGGAAASAGLGAASAGASATGAATTAAPATAGAAAAGATVAGATVAGAPVAGSAAAAGQAASGPVGAVVNVAVAVAAAAAAAVVAVLVDPQPAEAQESEVINPEQARVIFIRTTDEGWDSTFTHFSEDARDVFQALTDVDESLEDGHLTDIVVGVSPDQYQHPAWFLGSAVIPYQEGQASVFARFDREADDEPWLMSELTFALDRLLPPPLLDGDWLAPVPTDLLVDPASVPERYADWFLRSEESGELTDEVLVPRFEEAGMVAFVAENPLYYDGDDPQRVLTEWGITVGDVETDLIPLADGTVQLRFPATISVWTRYRPAFRPAACDQYNMNWEVLPGQRLRDAEGEFVGPVLAWVPVPSLVPEPPPDPEPTPEPTDEPEDEPEDEEDTEPAELELAPVDPETVVVEDWRLGLENPRGERC